ncbi:hypothetical protein GIJ38_15330 [Morganella morganii]|nr:hypothetical protein [Morganella morganii]
MSGNPKMRKITKLLTYLFLFYPLYFISKLTPRNNKNWVIGSKKNFSCNSKYFFINFYIENKNSDINLIWITPNKQLSHQLKSNGYKSEYKYSIRGLYYLLTAKVYITSYGSQYDLSYWTSGNTLLVYLWHGVGIKNINYSSDTPVMRKIYHSSHIIDKIAYSPYREKPDIFLSTSEFMNNHFSKAFNIPLSNIITSSYPRCSIFKMKSTDIINDIKSFELSYELKLLEKASMFDNLILYMPTWRDNDDNFMEKAIPNYGKLNEVLLSTNSLFIIKLHPNTELKDNNNYSNIVFIKNDIDPYPILYYTTLLITDYSSIYYDYLLKENYKTLLYPFDISSYSKTCRDLAYPYDEFTSGDKVYTFDELVLFLSKINNNTEFSNSEKIKEIFFQPHNKKQDIKTEIIKKLNYEN